MRRTPLTLVALATAAVLTGCGPAGTPPQAGSPTAVVPALLPADELLAANGIENRNSVRLAA